MIWCDVIRYDIYDDMICDVMWYDMIRMTYDIWYDVMWCDVIRYDTIWYMIYVLNDYCHRVTTQFQLINIIIIIIIMWCDTIRYDMICDMMWYDTIWYNVMWYDTIWYVIWYNAIRYDMIWYTRMFNCNCVDTRWQQYSTHLHTTNKRNAENGAYIRIKTLGIYITIKEFKMNLGSAGRATSLRVITWHLPYKWGRGTENSQLG
jgi:hypothetical protein